MGWDGMALGFVRYGMGWGGVARYIINDTAAVLGRKGILSVAIRF